MSYQLVGPLEEGTHDEQPGDFRLYSLIKLRVDNDLPVYFDGAPPPALDAVIQRIEADTGKSARVVRSGNQYGQATSDDGYPMWQTELVVGSTKILVWGQVLILNKMERDARGLCFSTVERSLFKPLLD